MTLGFRDFSTCLTAVSPAVRKCEIQLHSFKRAFLGDVMTECKLVDPLTHSAFLGAVPFGLAY